MSRTISRVAAVSALALGLSGVGVGTASAAWQPPRNPANHAPAPNAPANFKFVKIFVPIQNNVTNQTANANATATVNGGQRNVSLNYCTVTCTVGVTQANVNMANGGTAANDAFILQWQTVR